MLLIQNGILRPFL